MRSWEEIWPKNLELKWDNQSWLLAVADVCTLGVKIEQKELGKEGDKTPRWYWSMHPIMWSSSFNPTLHLNRWSQERPKTSRSRSRALVLWTLHGVCYAPRLHEFINTLNVTFLNVTSRDVMDLYIFCPRGQQNPPYYITVPGIVTVRLD